MVRTSLSLTTASIDVAPARPRREQLVAAWRSWSGSPASRAASTGGVSRSRQHRAAVSRSPPPPAPWVHAPGSTPGGRAASGEGRQRGLTPWQHRADRPLDTLAQAARSRQYRAAVWRSLRLGVPGTGCDGADATTTEDSRRGLGTSSYQLLGPGVTRTPRATDGPARRPLRCPQGPGEGLPMVRRTSGGSPQGAGDEAPGPSRAAAHDPRNYPGTTPPGDRT